MQVNEKQYKISIIVAVILAALYGITIIFRERFGEAILYRTIFTVLLIPSALMILKYKKNS